MTPRSTVHTGSTVSPLSRQSSPAGKGRRDRELFTQLQGLQIDAPRYGTLHYKVSIDKFAR
jgi:hypothetical protein